MDCTFGLDFYVDLARQARGAILDIACGTGRILLPCLQAGADGDGLDLSEAMLNTLRKKAAAMQLAPRLFSPARKFLAISTVAPLPRRRIT